MHLEATLGEYLHDEHRRYDLYLKALALAPEGQEKALVAIVGNDPDQSMSESVLVKYVDRVAGSRSSISFRDWIESMGEILPRVGFVRRRVEEWLTYKELMDGDDVPAIRYLGGSDWLQRKLSAEALSPEVISELALHGRTKRIRNVAKRRAPDLGSE
ncbi:MAG: hypothetical protein HYR62_10575 [Actinobacteria bacterium]|nr:hypothetical protein [Actinomycetota bacterium]MBI3686751.1 hypothetical protein [Actinomycetota bacterium]